MRRLEECLPIGCEVLPVAVVCIQTHLSVEHQILLVWRLACRFRSAIDVEILVNLPAMPAWEEGACGGWGGCCEAGGSVEVVIIFREILDSTRRAGGTRGSIYHEGELSLVGPPVVPCEGEELSSFG